MKIPQDGYLLRIFIGESDHWHGKPLYEAIVMKARELHIAGATVIRGPMGFGANSRLHTTKILRLSEDLPMIIEIVDAKEKIDELMPHIDEMVQEGLVTLERVQVIKYRANTAERMSRSHKNEACMQARVLCLPHARAHGLHSNRGRIRRPTKSSISTRARTQYRSTTARRFPGSPARIREDTGPNRARPRPDQVHASPRGYAGSTILWAV